MRIPGAIDRNILKAYEPRASAISGHSRTLESFNFESWDQQMPKTLQELCVESIAMNWAGKEELNIHKSLKFIGTSKLNHRRLSLIQ